MTQLPDTGLLSHDRACVIVRAQGHLIRSLAVQPATIIHVLDGVEPKKKEPATAQYMTITAKVQSPLSGHRSEYLDAIFQLWIKHPLGSPLFYTP